MSSPLFIAAVFQNPSGSRTNAGGYLHSEVKNEPHQGTSRTRKHASGRSHSTNPTEIQTHAENADGKRLQKKRLEESDLLRRRRRRFCEGAPPAALGRAGPCARYARRSAPVGSSARSPAQSPARSAAASCSWSSAPGRKSLRYHCYTLKNAGLNTTQCWVK